MAADPRIADLRRAGRIRLALFLPQYAKDPASGALRGVGMGFLGIELVGALAQELGLAMVVKEHPTPPAAVACIMAGDCDLIFLGVEHVQEFDLDFSPPIAQFDYSLLVPFGSSIHGMADADRPGVRIAVMRNHASTITLRRIAKHAELVGADLPDAAFDLLRAGGVDAFAAPRAQLLEYSAKLPGSRVLAESYGVNRVAMAIARNAERLASISEFVERAKTSGLIAGIIERGDLRGFAVAESR